MGVSKVHGGAALLAVAALVFAGCGGDDDDDAAGATAEQDAATAEDDGDEDEGSITVDDLDDIPDECVDLIGDFLERIEPIVEDVDWENASLEDFEGIGDEIAAEASEMEEDADSDQCDQYTLDGDGSLDALKEVAEDRAPGVLAFIEWQEGMLEGLQDDLADISIPDITIPDISIPDISIPDITIPDITIPDITLPAISLPEVDTAGAFEDCESAIAYFEGLLEQYDTMMEMPASDLIQVGNASSMITTDCSIDQMTEFFQRPDVQAFLSG